jgi:hypothetical protein
MTRELVGSEHSSYFRQLAMNVNLILSSKETLVGQYCISLGISLRMEDVERINRWTRHSSHTNAVTASLKATVAKSSFVPIPVIDSVMTWRPQLRHLAVIGQTNWQIKLSKFFFYIRSVVGLHAFLCTISCTNYLETILTEILCFLGYKPGDSTLQFKSFSFSILLMGTKYDIEITTCVYYLYG